MLQSMSVWPASLLQVLEIITVIKQHVRIQDYEDKRAADPDSDETHRAFRALKRSR